MVSICEYLTRACFRVGIQGVSMVTGAVVGSVCVVAHLITASVTHRALIIVCQKNNK